MILIEEEEGVVMVEGRRETISHEGLTLISRNALFSLGSELRVRIGRATHSKTSH